jgi:ubiquinone/menaquinone biosynthesis C-methylase UbiE
VRDTPPLVTNAAMIEAWDGAEGASWSTNADRYDAAVAHHHEVLMGAAAIASGDRVLDIGCGNGETTLAAASTAHLGSVVGVDLSHDMVAHATRRAQGGSIVNASFLRADAQTTSFERRAFDVVMSRFGLMFFDDPPAAFRNLAHALVTDGWLASVAWSEPESNEWISAIFEAFDPSHTQPRPRIGTAGPFGLADADRTRAWLVDAGFGEVRLDRFHRPFVIGTDADDAFEWFSDVGIARGLAAGLEPHERDAAFARLRTVIADHEGPDGVTFDSCAWLITARLRRFGDDIDGVAADAQLAGFTTARRG